MPAHRLTVKCVALFSSLLISIGLGGCQNVTTPIVRIGLVAPFEGRYREIGYDVIPAVRLAIRDWAASEYGTNVIIELVAYDDMGDPHLAVQQAHKLVTDPEVAIVIGHWRESTTQAAMSVYTGASLPLITYSTHEFPDQRGLYNLAPSAADMNDVLQRIEVEHGVRPVITTDDVLEAADVWESAANSAVDRHLVGGPGFGLRQFYGLVSDRQVGISFISWAAEPHDMRGPFWTDERATSFSEAFTEGSLGARPGLFSASAYEATWLALRLIGEQYGVTGIDDGPASDFRFDDEGRRVNAPIYYYEWLDEQRMLIAAYP